MDMFAGAFWAVALLWVAIRFIRSVQVVPTQRAYIAERLGRYHETLGPGFHFLLPFIDKVAYVQDLKEEAIEVPPQDCFTKDNVKVEVDGILYLSVTNPVNASYGITDYRFAAIQLVQTTTRSVIGTLELDRTFEERDLVNSRVLAALAHVSDAWGIQVHRYEVKGIVPPVSVREAMERQMNAERERRALLARSEGEKLTRINDSEGTKMEAINRSEGEMRRRVNEAEGKAAEILAIARATAESIETMGATLVSDGGADAVRMRLAQTYLGKLSSLARKNTEIVLAADLTDLGSLLKPIHDSFSVEAATHAPTTVVAPRPLAAGSVLAAPVARGAAPVQASSDTVPTVPTVPKYVPPGA
jgi:regulator of protease activity HflC (stomatin/prohibitin superfamily)